MVIRDAGSNLALCDGARGVGEQHGVSLTRGASPSHQSQSIVRAFSDVQSDFAKVPGGMSRKEHREALRAEREKQDARDAANVRKRRIVGYAIGGVLGVAILVGGVIAISGSGGEQSGESGAAVGDRVNKDFGVVPEGARVDDRQSTPAPVGETEPAAGVDSVQSLAQEAGCQLKLDQADEGSAHIDPQADTPDYKSNPPTSGDHSAEPLADGAFVGTVPATSYLHGLEHGRVAIQYRSDLPEQQQRHLLAVYDADPIAMMLFPNDDQQEPVTVTAWRNTLACDNFGGEAELAAMLSFRDTFRGAGPESVPLQ